MEEVRIKSISFTNWNRIFVLPFNSIAESLQISKSIFIYGKTSFSLLTSNILLHDFYFYTLFPDHLNYSWSLKIVLIMPNIYAFIIFFNPPLLYFAKVF